VDRQQWWDSLDPDTQDVLARDPRGPIPAGVLHEVRATTEAWTASWEGELADDDVSPSLPDELARFVEENNDALVQRLRDGAPAYAEAAATRSSWLEDPEETADPILSPVLADLRHARARGLPLPEPYR
jgi:hypothetical protein